MAITVPGVYQSVVYTRNGMPSTGADWTVFGRFCKTNEGGPWATFISVNDNLTWGFGQQYIVQIGRNGVETLNTYISSVAGSYIYRHTESNVWYDIGLVKTGSMLKTYFGSASDANLAISYLPIPSPETFAPLQIQFGDSYAPGEYLQGKIADIKIHNSVGFSDDQIEALRRTLVPGANVNVTHWYPMIDTTLANCLLDYSGNGYNATNTAGIFTVTDGPGIPYGGAVSVLSTDNTEYYGQGYPLTLTYAGNGTTATIPVQMVRAGETQLVSLAYGVTTALASNPAGWNILIDQALGKTRRVDFARAEPTGNTQTILNITLPASVPWVAQVSTFAGKIAATSASTTATANTFQIPTMQANVANVMWLNVLTNGTGNAKFFGSNGSSIVRIAEGTGSNATSGIGIAVSATYVPTARTLNYDNTWFVYDVTTGNANVISHVNLRNFTGNVRYDAVFLKNKPQDVSTEVAKTQLISKAGTANVLDYNSDYTVMFNYYHMSADSAGTYLDQTLWSLYNGYGYYDTTNNRGVFDSVVVNTNNTIAIKAGDGINGDMEIGFSSTSTTSLTANRWYTITVSRKLVAGNLYMYGYVDGRLFATLGIRDFDNGNTITYVTSPTYRSTQRSAYMVMGGEQYAGGSGSPRTYTTRRQVKGGFSNLREWNVCLTVDEIASESVQLYPTTRRANLFAHYPMLGSNVQQLTFDAVGSKHLQITSNVTNTTTYIIPEDVCSPLLTQDSVMIGTYVINPPTVRRGLYISNGNLMMVPVGSEKTANIIVIDNSGNVTTSNTRLNDYYLSFPSGRAVVYDSSGANVKTLDANSEILIR